MIKRIQSLCDFLNFSHSAYHAVAWLENLLKNEGYLLVDKEGRLPLTEQGSQAAWKIYERHTILTSALMALGLDRETAAEDACRMEHVISDKAFAALKAHMQKFTAESQ